MAEKGIELGDAWLNVVPSFRGAGKAIQQEMGTLDGQVTAHAQGWGSKISGAFGSAFKAIGGLALTGLTVATGFLASYSGEVLSASDATMKFKDTLNFAGLDTATIDRLTQSTKAYADKTVYDLADIQSITAQLASNGVAGFDSLAEAAGNLNAVAGGNKETFKSVGMVLTQTAGAGKLTTENWNQLSDAIPGASGKIQEALAAAGAYTGNFREEMAKGEITAEEFNAAIMELGMSDVAKEAAASIKTFEGAWGNFEATIVSGMSRVLEPFKGPITDALGQFSDRVAAIFDRVGAAAEGFASGSGLSSALSGIGPILGLVASAAGPLLSMIPGLGGAFAGLTGPVGLLAGALVQMVVNSQDLQAAFGHAFGVISGALAGAAPLVGQLMTVIGSLLAQLGDELAPIVVMVADSFAALITGVLPAAGQLISSLGSVLSTLIPVVADIAQSILAGIMPAIQAMIPALVSIMDTAGMLIEVLAPLVVLILSNLGPAFEGLSVIVATTFSVIADVITNAMTLIQEIISVWIAVFTGDWDGAWEHAKAAFAAMWDTIASILGGAAQIVGGVLQGFLTALLGSWSSTWDRVKGFVPASWASINAAVTSGIASMLASLQSIPDRVKALFANAGTWLINSGRAIIDGLKNGIMSAFPAVEDAVSSGLAQIRDLFPFSPAKKGPFSGRGWVLYSGMSIPEALADGVAARRGLFEDAVSSMMYAAAPRYIPQSPTLVATSVASHSPQARWGEPSAVTFNVTAHDPQVAARVIRQEMRDLMGVMS